MKADQGNSLCPFYFQENQSLGRRELQLGVKVPVKDVAKLVDKDLAYAKLYLSSREEALKIAKDIPDNPDLLIK